MIFASELKAFFQVNDTDYILNKNAVLEYLKRSYVPSPLSILKNVFKLQPGHYLRIKTKNLFFNNSDEFILNKIEIKNWNQEIKTKFSYNQVEQKIEELIENSVKEKLISDVPVGCLLSGGIDSSLISYFAQKNSNKQLRTFSISFDDDQYDETVYANIVSKKIRSKHFTKKFIAKDIIKIIKNISTTYCEPFADSSQLPTILLSKYVSKNIKVVLTGDGGDEIFGGYNRYYNLERIWNISKILPRAIVKKIFYLINKIPLKYVSKIMDLIFLFSFTKNKIIQPITKFQKISYGFENSNYLKEFFDNVTKENWVDKKYFKKIKK